MQNRFIEAIKLALELILSMNKEVTSITLFSFYISFVAVLFATLTAIPFGILIASIKFPGRNFLITLLNTFTGFPPVVMGVFLYLLFSRTGPLGFLHLLFTPHIMILAQYLLSFPIIASFTIQAIENINPILLETLKTLPYKEEQQVQVLFHEVRKELVGGIIFAFGRAISEVGAIIIVGGNIRWKTRTLTTAAVQEAGMGRIEMAMALGIILLTAAVLINLGFRIIQNEKSFNLKRARKKSFSAKKTSTLQTKNNHEKLELFKITESCQVQAKNITKTINGKTILQDISLELQPGTITVILGPNGAGKSTLLRILSKLDPEYQGKVQDTLGCELQYSPLLHQIPVLFKGNINFNLKCFTSIEQERSQYLQDLLGITLLENDNAMTVSGGERRLISLARLLQFNPPILFLDEVTADLDPANVAIVEKLLVELKKQNHTIVISTHNLLQAKRIADQVVILMNGKMIEKGSTFQVFENPQNEKVKAFLQGDIPW